MLDSGINLEEVNRYAFSGTQSDILTDTCEKADFRLFIKPTKNAALDLFRHMAIEEEDLEENYASNQTHLQIPEPPTGTKQQKVKKKRRKSVTSKGNGGNTTAQESAAASHHMYSEHNVSQYNQSMSPNSKKPRKDRKTSSMDFDSSPAKMIVIDGNVDDFEVDDFEVELQELEGAISSRRDKPK